MAQTDALLRKVLMDLLQGPHARSADVVDNSLKRLRGMVASGGTQGVWLCVCVDVHERSV